MTSKQRAYLMSLASNLNPIFQVGKSSLTPELTAAIGESFNNNELIKIGVLKNCCGDGGGAYPFPGRTGDRQEDRIVQARQGQAEDRTAPLIVILQSESVQRDEV